MIYTSTPFRQQKRITLKRIGIITKRGDNKSTKYGEMLSEWFIKAGIATSFNTTSSDLDMIFVLGGDGTLLHVAEDAAKESIPVLGINLGNLGFLTELTKDEVFSAIEKMISSEVTIENRLMLRARILGNPKGVSRYALNDVVIAKNVLDPLLNLSSRADDEHITTYRADGVIFSTPTGSTAYNLSAGGPLVYPGLATITVTPICPFMLSSRPIILPAEKIITTTFDRTNIAERAQIIIDGQLFCDMKQGDELEITTASHYLQLVISSTRDYFTILRNKLNWATSGDSLRSQR